MRLGESDPVEKTNRSGAKSEQEGKGDSGEAPNAEKKEKGRPGETKTLEKRRRSKGGWGGGAEARHHRNTPGERVRVSSIVRRRERPFFANKGRPGGRTPEERGVEKKRRL